jgi:hypothetical protein
MLVTNHYEHCGVEWDLEECDSFHNDHCPICDREIEPFSATEYTEEGTEEHYFDK